MNICKQITMLQSFYPCFQFPTQVLEWLPTMDEQMLTRICTDLSIQIPLNKTGKKTMILKLILKHLNSEAVEG